MRIIYSIVFISLLSVGFVGNLKAWDENGEAVCLAKNIYFEAGNQSKAGRLAVGLVTLNRVEMREYPDTICGVVHQGPTYTNWKETHGQLNISVSLVGIVMVRKILLKTVKLGMRFTY